MKCAGCLKPTKDTNSIKCTTTGCVNSFCNLCLNVSSLTNERKKSWKCPDCSASTKKGGDNTLPPVRPGTETQNVTMRKKSETLPEQSGSDLKELTAELRQLTREFTSLSTKLEEVTQSLNHCHGRMDDLVDSMKATDARIKSLERRDQEVIDLKSSVSHLQAELNAQAQHSLRNEIEIAGIPEIPNENLQHVVLVAAQKLGVALQDNDVDYITRVGARRPLNAAASAPEMPDRMPRPVVVRLIRRYKRDQILSAAKSRRNINSSDLEVAGGPIKVFFNERLTKQNRVLFRDARSRAKTHGYLFCWCSQGSIYIRQREGKSAVVIRTQEDLDRVLPAESISADRDTRT